MRIGILGGTFDPVHRGHLEIAREAREAQDLAEVLMIPAGRPPIKTETAVSPAEHRLRMLELAATGTPYLKVSEIEIERTGPSYTVDTVAQLRNCANEEDELYFILGWDSLKQMPVWHEPACIIEICWLIAVPRPGCNRPDMDLLEKEIPGIKERTALLDGPLVDISASEIRGMAARGESIERLVPVKVAEYIKTHSLYRG